MIKKITLDTNNDLYGESVNFYLEIINNETNVIITEYTVFREIMDGASPTGIYFTEVDLATGNYMITVKHTTINQDGSIHFIIREDGHVELEENIMGIIKDADDGVAFA